MSYRGNTAVIRSGIAGLTSDVNMSRVPHEALIEARGVIADRQSWRKEPGSVAYGMGIPGAGNNAAPAVLAFHSWWPTDAIQYMVTAASDGKLYRDAGDGDLDAVTLASGMSNAARGIFVECGAESASANRKLIYFSNGIAPKVVSGTGNTAGNIASPPADWANTSQPIGATLHRSRLWGYGNPTDPHRLYGSNSSNHEEFVTGGVNIPVYSGVGQQIVSVKHLQQRLYVWKYPVGIFWINDTDLTVSNWVPEKKSDVLGAAPSPHAVLAMDEDALWITPDGRVHLLSMLPDNSLSNSVASDLSSMLRFHDWITENVNLDRLDQVVSWWDTSTKRATFCLPSKFSQVNDLRMILDFQASTRPGDASAVFTVSQRTTCESLGGRDVSGLRRPMAGTAAGQIIYLDDQTRSNLGQAYDGSYQTPYDDFSWLSPELASLKKRYDALELVFSPTGDWEVAVDILIDGDYKKTLQFSMQGLGGLLGDPDTPGPGDIYLDDGILGIDMVQQHTRRIGLKGNRISLRPHNGALGQDFSISHHIIHFRALGETEP